MPTVKSMTDILSGRMRTPVALKSIASFCKSPVKPPNEPLPRGHP